MTRTDQRAGLGLVVVGAAEPDGLRALDERVDERVVDLLLHQQAGAGRADLAGVQEDRGEGVVERDVQVGVREDDVGVLAAELEGDLLDRRRSGGHHPAAGDEATGERDEVDPRVLGEQRARVGPGAQHQVAHARGQAGLLEEPHQVDARVRGELARLEHEGVAGGQAGRDLPRRLEQRVVPRGDQAADAERLVDDPAHHVGVAGVDDPSRLLGGDPAVVAEDRDDVGHVVLALDEPLAGVARLGLGDDVGVTLEEVGGAEQQVAALAGRGAAPGSVAEGPVRRVDGRGRVLAVRLVDLGDERPVGRTGDRAPPARARTDPRTVDVEVRHPVNSSTVLRQAQRIADPATNP